MPLPRWVARANRYGVNRILGPLAPHLPGFGVVIHTGRKSGRNYRTPVNVFRTPDGYVVALTYGPNSDWVRNVLARGGCTLETRGRRVALVQPRLVHEPQGRAWPWLVRVLLALSNVSYFLELKRAAAA